VNIIILPYERILILAHDYPIIVVSPDDLPIAVNVDPSGIRKRSKATTSRDCILESHAVRPRTRTGRENFAPNENSASGRVLYCVCSNRICGRVRLNPRLFGIDAKIANLDALALPWPGA